MLTRSELVVIRDFHPDDKNFILSTWLRGLRYGNSWFLEIEPAVYFKVYQKVVEMLLANPKVLVRVACLAEDPRAILGYAVYSGKRIDYVFVRKKRRGIGIATSLVPIDIKVASHLTDVGRSIARKKGISFNPFDLG